MFKENNQTPERWWLEIGSWKTIFVVFPCFSIAHDSPKGPVPVRRACVTVGMFV